VKTKNGINQRAGLKKMQVLDDGEGQEGLEGVEMSYIKCHSDIERIKPPLLHIRGGNP